MEYDSGEGEVSNGVNARRPTRREVAAAETRREILRTARRLFAENGFAQTSVQQIAEKAGVAVQTIYSSVGSKPALVLALNDLIDEEADVARLAGEILEEADPAQLIAKTVHLTRQICERCGDIIQALMSAAPAEPEAAVAVAEGMRRHEQGTSQVAERLGALGALRPGTSTERAAAAISIMTSPASWRQLSQRPGWTFDGGEVWLTSSLCQLLLLPPMGWREPGSGPPSILI
jgi:AcrR family transcriptional regulator